MPSPFDTTRNTSTVGRQKRVHKFLDPENNEVRGENKHLITVTLEKKFLNVLLDNLPYVRNHMDQFYNPSDLEDVQAREDFEQMYQELVQLKQMFQKEKEKEPEPEPIPEPEP